MPACLQGHIHSNENRKAPSSAEQLGCSLKTADSFALWAWDYRQVLGATPTFNCRRISLTPSAQRWAAGARPATRRCQRAKRGQECTPWRHTGTPRAAADGLQLVKHCRRPTVVAGHGRWVHALANCATASAAPPAQQVPLHLLPPRPEACGSGTPGPNPGKLSRP